MRAAALLRYALPAALLALAGCGQSDSRDPGEVRAAEQGLPTLTIHRETRTGPGSVNAYWIEGSDGIVIFDTQRDPDLAARFASEIEQAGKPVIAIIVSHYHADHFAGLPYLAEAFPDARILMPEAVAEQLSEDPSGYVEQVAALYGEDFGGMPEADGLLTGGEELNLSGVPMTVSIVDEAEASPILMLAVPSQNALLASDLVVSGMHPNMADADLDSWPRALERLSRDFPNVTLYPGHGEQGPANLLVANQTAYLNFMRTLVINDLIDDDVATESQIAAALTQIRGNYPDWESTTGRPAQLRRNLEAMIEKLGGRLALQRRVTAGDRESRPSE
ncbi:MAG: MBL fold metallo-hydrolase [Sphingomonadaceae bacterium]|nr:MBL fold metallo-hydrolase [Sphingomonadaceae bacterium]